MTLDAMHWVWSHSQTKGNARLVLLFVADQVRTSECTARVSYADLQGALNSRSRTTISSALEAAKKTGELEIEKEGAGRRAPVYRLSKAVGYVRPAVRSSPTSGPQDIRSGPEVGPQEAQGPPVTGPEVGPQDIRSGPDFVGSGPEVGPPYPYPTTTQQAGSPEGVNGSEQSTDAFVVCQPLIQAMTDAGITVSWQMDTRQWAEIVRIVNRAGVRAMVEHAIAVARTAREKPRYVKFFLAAGWRGLPPARTHPQPATPRPHCGDIYCDPDSRVRSYDDEHGYRRVAPCPDCHPNATRGTAA